MCCCWRAGPALLGPGFGQMGPATCLGTCSWTGTGRSPAPGARTPRRWRPCSILRPFAGRLCCAGLLTAGRRTACAKRRAPAPRGADTERGRVNTQHVCRHWAALGRKQSKGKGRFYLAAQVFAVAYDYFKLICVKISLLKGCRKIT